MKKYIIITLILLLAAACNSSQPVSVAPSPAPVPSPAPDPMATWQTYKNNSYNFDFRYPQNFSFQTPTYGFLSGQIVQIAPDQNDYPGTNYADSALTVSTAFAKDASQCLIVPNSSKPLTQTKVINGETFYQGSATGAGAGNLYNSTIYRALRQNTCTEVSLTVHTGNIGNYPAGTVTEVDQSKPMAALEQILATFKFTK